MNLILLFESDFLGSPNRVRLFGRRFEYINNIHRAAIDDRLRVGLLNNKLGYGTVVGITHDSIEMEIVLSNDPPEPLPATLLIALPRPKIFKKILLFAVTVGIKKIYFMRTWRVEKSYWQSPVLVHESIKRLCLLGLEQSKDTVMPSIELRPLFKPFIEDEVPGIVRGSKAFMAHPAAENQCPRDIGGPAVLAVGPEGGFIEYELSELKKIGFEPVNAGTRTLLVEHALPVLIGRMF